jgi:hypothetical protein
VVWNIFPHILGIIIPTDFDIFQRGRYTTNQLPDFTFNFKVPFCDSNFQVVDFTRFFLQKIDLWGVTLSTMVPGSSFVSKCQAPVDVAALSKGKVPFNRGGMAPNSGIRNGDRKNRERKIHIYICVYMCIYIYIFTLNWLVDSVCVIFSTIEMRL